MRFNNDIKNTPTEENFLEAFKMILFDDYNGRIISNIDESKLLTKEEFQKEADEIYSNHYGIPIWSYGEDNTKVNVIIVILRTSSVLN